MLIQPILFPPLNLINEPELFFRGVCAEDISETSVSIPAGEDLSLETYFNAFSIGKWTEYTALDNLSLVLELDGEVEINAFHAIGSVDSRLLGGGVGKLTDEEYSHKINCQAYKAAREKAECSISKQGNCYTVQFEKLYNAGILYVTIKAVNGVVLKKGYYATEIDKSLLNPVKIAIGICTFKREEAVTNNVKCLIEEIIDNSESPLKDKLEVYIADNGQTLVVNSFKSDKVHLFPNPNLGGSGGFTRTMIEAMFYDVHKEFTHIIFMDDDILLYPAVLERSFYLLSLLKPKYKKAILGAGMLALEEKNLQQELGALYKDEDIVPGKINHKFFDLRIADSISANEVVNKTNYTGWWYACIPRTIISGHNLPMPFFIHYDDVEYGLRNVKNGQLFINGICVWHPKPANKNPYWILYYDVRNRLITMFTKALKKEDLMTSLSKMTKNYILDLVGYSYEIAKLKLLAIQDFLKGPNTFISLDALALHTELLKRKGIYISPEKAGVDPNNIISERYPNFKLAVLVQVLCNLLPAKNKIRAINSRYLNIPYRAKKLYFYNEKINEGIIFERNNKEFFSLFFSFFKVQREIKKRYKELLKDWQASKSTMNSLSFWEGYLNLVQSNSRSN